jgi:hypothetical protein
MATTATRSLRTRLVHLKRAAIQRGSVQLRNHLFHFLAGAEFDEPEPAGAARPCVANHTCGGHLESLCRKELLKALVRRVK